MALLYLTSAIISSPPHPPPFMLYPPLYVVVVVVEQAVLQQTLSDKEHESQQVRGELKLVYQELKVRAG